MERQKEGVWSCFPFSPLHLAFQLVLEHHVHRVHPENIVKSNQVTIKGIFITLYYTIKHEQTKLKEQLCEEQIIDVRCLHWPSVQFNAS